METLYWVILSITAAAVIGVGLQAAMRGWELASREFHRRQWAAEEGRINVRDYSRAMWSTLRETALSKGDRRKIIREALIDVRASRNFLQSVEQELDRLEALTD